jgi:hypothetical protein
MSLLIDESIRNWGMMVIVYVSILIGVLRNQVGSWLAMTSKKEKQRMKSAHNLALVKGLGEHMDRLCMMSGWLGKESFLRRKAFYAGENGYLAKQGEEVPAPDMSTAMQGQNAMFGNMKNMLVMMVSSMAMLYWARMCYSGMIIARVPFPLTQRFRGMTQMGLEIEALDVGFVSGMCFYFIVMIGLGSLQTLFTEEESAEFSEMGSMNMQQKQMQAQPDPDLKRMLSTRASSIELTQHEFLLADCSRRLTDALKAE